MRVHTTNAPHRDELQYQLTSLGSPSYSSSTSFTSDRSMAHTHTRSNTYNNSIYGRVQLSSASRSTAEYPACSSSSTPTRTITLPTAIFADHVISDVRVRSVPGNEAEYVGGAPCPCSA